MAARVADVPEAPKRWDPLPGIVQLIYQVTRAQIEIFHFARACPFQGDKGRAHLDASVDLGGSRIVYKKTPSRSSGIAASRIRSSRVRSAPASSPERAESVSSGFSATRTVSVVPSK